MAVESEVFSFFVQRIFWIRGAPGGATRGGGPPPQANARSATATAALIYLHHTLTRMLETESYVRVIALDFSKAFDTVRHVQLVNKLSILNIPSKINGWIANFLKSRSHTTMFEGQMSSSSAINSSVVQGSALGPTAFIIVASDLATLHSSNALAKFAYDTYLIIPATCVHTCVCRSRVV